MTKRYRKGELQFYLDSTPKEIALYGKEYPDNAEYVNQFLQQYTFNFVKKTWVKKEESNIFKRMQGEL